MQRFQVLPCICSGPDAARALRAYSRTRALLLTDADPISAARRLRAALPGTELLPCPAQALQNPDTLLHVTQAAERHGVRAVLALGGPESMQAAKRLHLSLPRRAALACVPDVFGAAECLCDTLPLHAGQASRALSGPALGPDRVILDAALTFQGTAAQRLEAALYQAALALEAVCAPGAGFLSNALALDALEALLPILHLHASPEAQLLLRTGCASGAAANSAGSGVCMALLRAACTLVPELSPGCAALLLLPEVLNFYAPECAGPFRLLSARLNLPDGPERALRCLPEALWLRAEACSGALLPHLHAIANAAGSDPRLSGSPRPAGPAELRTLLRCALRPRQTPSSASQSSASRSRKG